MPEAVMNELILEHLKRIQSDLVDIKTDMLEVKAFPLIHEVYPAAWKKFRHWSGVKRSQMSPMASMS